MGWRRSDCDRRCASTSRKQEKLATVPTAMTRSRKTATQPALFPDIHVGNSILTALLATEYKRLRPKLEHVTLTSGEIIYRADQNIERVYFPEEAVIAMVDRTNDGRTVEVGIIGREGLVGINIFLGGVVTPDK